MFKFSGRAAVIAVPTLLLLLGGGLIISQIWHGAEHKPQPLPIHFSSEDQAPLNRYIYSDVAVIRNILEPVLLDVTWGEVSIDGGAYTQEPQLVVAGQTVRVRVKSGADFGATTTAVLQIGGLITEFKVKTQAEDYVIELEKPFFEVPTIGGWA